MCDLTSEKSRVNRKSLRQAQNVTCVMGYAEQSKHESLPPSDLRFVGRVAVVIPEKFWLLLIMALFFCCSPLRTELLRFDPSGTAQCSAL